MRVELIEWVDSRSYSGWSSRRNYTEFAVESSLVCRSVGMVIHESDERVVLLQSITVDEDPDQLMDCGIAIPKVAIISRKLFVQEAK